MNSKKNSNKESKNEQKGSQNSPSFEKKEDTSNAPPASSTPSSPTSPAASKEQTSSETPKGKKQTSSEPPKEKEQTSSEPPKEVEVKAQKTGPKSNQEKNKKPLLKENLPEIKLNGFFAFKKGMSTIYNEKREAIVVTYLKYEPWYVSQIKSQNKEGYEAIQLACKPQSFKKSIKPKRGHFKKTNFEHSAHYLKEIKQNLPKGLQLGQKVAFSSLSKGDKVKITSRSKGKGFSGVMKRWGFGGGPASHGSTFHRNPGSIGNCTEPSRVMPGRKMPGRHGFKNHTLNSVEIMDMIPEANTLLVKGSIPGSKNTLVKLLKV